MRLTQEQVAEFDARGVLVARDALVEADLKPVSTN